jgi:FdhD protein
MDAAKKCRALRMTARRPEPESENCEAIAEEAVTIALGEAGNFILLATPSDVEALAVGFAYSEGLLTKREEIAGVRSERTGPWTVRVDLNLRHPPEEIDTRNLIVTSSCGLCGKHIETGLSGPPVGRSLSATREQLVGLAAGLRERQSLFSRTGGAHAAAVFDADGSVLGFAEDLGRHNAMDKAIGKLVMEGLDPRGLGVLLSGRVSYELATKAARAGIEIIAAVSAPSALAIEACEVRNVTLCCFVREDRITVFAHPERIRTSAFPG